MTKDFIGALGKVQAELKAPKNRVNKFGGYNYRSCEDILEAVKPLLMQNGLLLTVSDEMTVVEGWHFVKATVTVTDGTDSVSVSASARESVEKKGMDASQITGTASSYARKYALNGLFLIDDVKDADTDEYKNMQTASEASQKFSGGGDVKKTITQEDVNDLIALINRKGADSSRICKHYRVKSLGEMLVNQLEEVKATLNTRADVLDPFSEEDNPFVIK